jgi:hypothetical protein
MAPKIIRKPIEAIVLPNPSFRVLTIEAAGRVTAARRRDTIKRAVNACSLNLVVSAIISMMEISISSGIRAEFMSLAA